MERGKPVTARFSSARQLPRGRGGKDMHKMHGVRPLDNRVRYGTSPGKKAQPYNPTPTFCQSAVSRPPGIGAIPPSNTTRGTLPPLQQGSVQLQSMSVRAGGSGKAIPICHQLGLPIAPEKVEGPSTTITFLGIEIDSVAQVLRLPDKKLNRLRGMLAEWEGRRSATKHQLQSLIGHLSHASKVVKPG